MTAGYLRPLYAAAAILKPAAVHWGALSTATPYGTPMDVLYIGIVAVFFVLTLGLVRLCERL